MVVSIVETAVFPPTCMVASTTEGESGGGLSALRTLRVFRVLKLIRFIPSLRILVATIVAMVQHILPFMMLTSLMIFIFTLMGMQFFANRLRFDDAGYSLQTGSPRWFASSPQRLNFDSFMWAITTVFVVITGENWNEVYYDAFKALEGQGAGGRIALIERLESTSVHRSAQLVPATRGGGTSWWGRRGILVRVRAPTYSSGSAAAGARAQRARSRRRCCSETAAAPPSDRPPVMPAHGHGHVHVHVHVCMRMCMCARRRVKSASHRGRSNAASSTSGTARLTGGMNDMKLKGKA